MVFSKEELGELIKKARLNKAESIGRKYTQEMLANDVGVSRSYIGDYESGRRYPKYDVLAKKYKVTEAEIMRIAVEELKKSGKI